jgi:hypothetical protein
VSPNRREAEDSLPAFPATAWDQNAVNLAFVPEVVRERFRETENAADVANVTVFLLGNTRRCT